MLTCANCGRESPDDFAFCPACASPLTPAPQPRDVRKTVTVLFCDVAGSTSLGEKLDPESLRKVMSRYFEELRSVLERHGGTVEKFIGDAVMAVFGIPQLHEDDALRAVRAAAEIREALRLLNKELERDWGVTIAAGTGVNTGEVVAGDPAAGQTLVTGDAVNVAARLEQAAAPGEILIGDETHRLVRDAVAIEPVEPLSLKGKGETVPAFRLLEVFPGIAGHVRRLDSPMVGRDRESTLLRQAFERAVSDRACQLFTILGAPGVGKSRLVEEFLATLGGATVLRGRCLPYGEGITYFPVLEIVKQAAGLADFDAPELVETKICAVLEGEEHQDVVCKRVAQLMGVSELAAPEETFWAIRRMIEAVARERALVLVFDDLHWGEPTFLDLVEHIADWSRDAPILLICMARPDLLDARPAWAGGKLNAATISLEPLTEEECEVLIENLLGRAELASDVRDRIAEAAEGNPLFVEEMLAMLIDDRLLARDDGRWVPTADLSGISVPPTISVLLAARLDRLRAEERAVIERASVVGKVFYRGAVRELSPEGERAGVTSHLMTLIRKELVRPDRSTLPGEDAFRFRHLLIRDAAYESMPKELRAELHERYADWLERVAGDRVAEQEEILGYHLEQGFRLRAELGPVDELALTLAVRAAERLARAGRGAFSRGDLAAAANLFGRAVSLYPEDDPRALALYPDLGAALSDLGDLDRAEEQLTRAMQVAETSGDRALRSHASVQLMLSVRLWADPHVTGEEVLSEAREAITVFEELGDELGLARGWRLVGLVHYIDGDVRAGGSALERALGHARKAGATRDEAEAADFIGGTFAYGPRTVGECLRYTEEIEELAERDLIIRADALVYGGARVKAMLGRFEEARDLYRQGKAILEDLGVSERIAGAAVVGGYVEMLSGDPEAAERELRAAYEMPGRLTGTALASLAVELSRAVQARGDYGEGEQLTRVAEENSLRIDREMQAAWRSARAMCFARQGRIAEAERLAREAVALIERTEWVDSHAQTLMDLAEVLTLAGQPAEAATSLREALHLYERKGNVVLAGRARALLDELRR